ncbi:MAG: 3-deoxy-manno-octulosonate cytidylyltransferase [Chitinophagales bacterium]|nr:3-deoxy-manno-octulosonate cytidylyltransferase [Chitinophagales bacterium]
MKIVGIIPARYESSRFPGKPLAMISGKSMIQRVYKQAKKATNLTEVYVATDDERIIKEVETFGGQVIMTAKEHLNGTSRCAEALEILNKSFNYIINIQGDEPLINPLQINELASLFLDEHAEIITQVAIETDLSLLENKNIVKAILDKDCYALDFKRKLSESTLVSSSFFRHVGIYGFKTDVLKKIVQLTPTKNELEEHLEQLRWIDNKFIIKSGITKYKSISIDTKEDLRKVINYIESFGL